MCVVTRMNTGHIRIWCLYTCLGVQVQLKSCDIWLGVQEVKNIKLKILYQKKQALRYLRPAYSPLFNFLFLQKMRKTKTVGFLYFSLYTQLWNEVQTWGCSCCPFLHQLLWITNCSVFLQLRLHSKCFPQRIYSLTESATGDFGHKEASEEILNRWKETDFWCLHN